MVREYISPQHIYRAFSDIDCPVEELSCESGWIGAAIYEFYLDRDRDGIADADDNCPDEPNSDQTDDDGDNFGVACDCDGQ